MVKQITVTSIFQCTISDLPASLERRLFKAISSDLPQLSASLNISALTPVHPKRRDVLWYGGSVAELHYKGWTFELYAAGDVYADLYEDDKHILYVKDKSNAGRLGEELVQHFQTDKALKAAKHGTHSKYRLELEHNNWWECIAFDPSGVYHDLMLVLNSDDFVEALAEIVSLMDDVIKEKS